MWKNFEAEVKPWKHIRTLITEEKPNESGRVLFSYHTSKDVREFTWEKPYECMKFGNIFVWKSVLIICQRLQGRNATNVNKEENLLLAT